MICLHTIVMIVMIWDIPLLLRIIICLSYSLLMEIWLNQYQSQEAFAEPIILPCRSPIALFEILLMPMPSRFFSSRRGAAVVTRIGYDKKSDEGSNSVRMRHENSGAATVVENWLPTRVSDSSDAQLSDYVFIHYGVKSGRCRRQRPFSPKKMA